jgi:cation:H+ antiporter
VVFGGTAVVLIAAAVALARAADTLAERTGIGRVWVGSALLAMATSLPELGVEIAAVRQGAIDLAMGDIFGSSMGNMLILAVLGLVPPRDGVFRRASPDHTLAASFAIVATALAAALVFTRSPAVLGGVHPGTLGLLATFLLGSSVVYRQGRWADAAAADAASAASASASAAAVSAAGTAGADTAAPPAAHGFAGAWRRPAAEFAVAAAVLLLVAPSFAHSAADMAASTGVGQTVFGTLVVGLATSLPEIVTCVAALRMGAPDLAVGNLFGSNLFNTVMFVPMELAHPGPSLFAVASPEHGLTALLAIMLMALGSASVAFRAQRRVAMAEPGAVLMVVAYAAGVLLLVQRSAGG